MKISLITILCILTFVVSVQAEPVVITRGIADLSWEKPDNFATSTLSGYLIIIYENEKIIHQAEVSDTHYSYNYAIDFSGSRTVEIKVWSLGKHVDTVTGIIYKDMSTSYASIIVTLSENTNLTSPQGIAVN